MDNKKYARKYTDLSVIQRIGLKGFITTMPELARYHAVYIMWGFVAAVELFLTEDLGELEVKLQW